MHDEVIRLERNREFFIQSKKVGIYSQRMEILDILSLNWITKHIGNITPPMHFQDYVPLSRPEIQCIEASMS